MYLAQRKKYNRVCSMECMMHLNMIFFERFFLSYSRFPKTLDWVRLNALHRIVNKLTNRTGKEAGCLDDKGVLLLYDTYEIHGELISSQITAFEYKKISPCVRHVCLCEL